MASKSQNSFLRKQCDRGARVLEACCCCFAIVLWVSLGQFLAEVSRMGGWFCIKFGSLHNGLGMLRIVYHNTTHKCQIIYLFKNLRFVM
jgi:hypothetical protein